MQTILAGTAYHQLISLKITPKHTRKEAKGFMEAGPVLFIHHDHSAQGLTFYATARTIHELKPNN